MTITGSALTAAGKLGLKALKQYAATNEFDRLCQRLESRFSDRAPLGAADYGAFVTSPAFARALDRLVGLHTTSLVMPSSRPSRR